MRRDLFLLASLVSIACDRSPAPSATSTSGLATVVDSSRADTIVATTAGEVPSSAIRAVVEELRIAPTAEDTSLFSEIFEFDVDRSGRIWAFDQGSSSILLFANDGRLLRRVGRKGAGPGEFAQNSGMVVVGDSGLAMWDSGNARVTFLSPSGDYERAWPTPGGFFTSNALVADRDGTLRLRRPVTAPREGEILGRMGLVRVLPTGGFADSTVPPDLAVPREVYVAYESTKQGRNSASTASQFQAQYVWAWHPDGYFLVGNSGKYELILARSKPTVIRRTAPEVAVRDDERSDEEARVLWQMRSVDPGWKWQGPPIAKVKPPISSVLVARDGRIWVRVATPSQPLPAEEIAPPAEAGAPQRRFFSPAVWEVFEPNGTFVGRVALPRRTSLMEADGDVMWAITRDADDLPAIVRLRVTPTFSDR